MNQKLFGENKQLKFFDIQLYKESLKFGLYTMTHPLDGFWDLSREKRGTLAAAHTFVFLLLLVNVLTFPLSSFQFVLINMETFNIVMVIAQTIVPLGLWVLSNWCLTTLMDGKGRLSHIYMAMAYATVPFIIIQAILIPLSHIITFEEGAIYWGLYSLSIMWMTLLIVCSMMQIHEYTMAKTILSSIFTLFGIAVMVFIFIVFFSVISDGINYFVALFREFWLRIS